MSATTTWEEYQRSFDPTEDQEWAEEQANARHEQEERDEASAATVAEIVATIALLEAETRRGGWRAIDLRVWREELAIRVSS